MRELSLNNCRIDKRYDVVENLGRGSYAEIFVARDTLASPQSVHSKVVIKALNVFLQDDLDADLERRPAGGRRATAAPARPRTARPRTARSTDSGRRSCRTGTTR